MVTGFVPTQKYSVGRLENPTKDDEQFDDVVDAEITAIERSIDDGVWAVWENKTDEIIAIVYQQHTYHP